MLLHPGSKENYFLRLRKGFIFQFHNIKAKNYKASFRIRGEGEISFGILRRNAKWKNLGMNTVAKLSVNEKEWTFKSIEFAHPTGDLTENHAFLFWTRKGTIDIDDLFLAGK